MKAANLGVRFLLELCALTALAVWGWQVSDRVVVSVLLAIAAPLLAADHPRWAVALAVGYAVNVSLGFAWHQRAH